VQLSPSELITTSTEYPWHMIYDLCRIAKLLVSLNLFYINSRTKYFALSEQYVKLLFLIRMRFKKEKYGFNIYSTFIINIMYVYGNMVFIFIVIGIC